MEKPEINSTELIPNQETVDRILKEQLTHLDSLSLEEKQKMINTLQTYKQQLETQNEQLQKTQVQLKEIHRMYFDLYQFAPIGYFAFDREGIIIDVNQVGATLLGRPRNFLIGKPLIAYLAPEVYSSFYKHQNDVFRTGILQTCELTLKRLDGFKVEVQIESLAMKDTVGNLTQYRSVVIDITTRKRTENALRLTQANLKTHVEASTSKLSEANRKLKEEIVQRKQAEEALIESKIGFRMMFANNPHPMWVYDLQTLQLLEINDAAIAKYGYSREEFLQMSITDIWLPEDAPRLQKVVSENQLILQNMGHWQHRCKDEQIIDVEITSHQLKFAERDAALVVAQDITEQKRTEAVKQHYAQRLETLHKLDQAILAAQSPSEIARIALHHLRKLIHCQRVSVALFDYETEKIIMLAVDADSNTTISTNIKLPLQAYDISANLKQLNPSFTEDLKTKPNLSRIEKQLLAENIRSCLSIPLSSHGELIGSLNLGATKTNAFNQDAIEIVVEVGNQLALAIKQARLLEAEQQARRVAETMQAANMALTQTLDLDDVLKRLLDYLQQLVPYTSANVMLLEDNTHLIIHTSKGYKQWADVNLIHQKRFSLDSDSIFCDIITTKKSMLVADTSQNPNWKSDSSTDYIRSWLGVPLIAGGNVIGLYSMDHHHPQFFTKTHRQLAETLAAQASIAIQNAYLHKQIQQHVLKLEERVTERTTELRETNAQLAQEVIERKQAEEAAQAASRAKSEFLANISHELRTPLNGILGYTQLLQKDTELTENQAKAVSIMKQSGDHLLTLINDILDLSKIEAGRMELQLVEFQLTYFLKKLINVFQMRSQEKGIKFVYEPRSNLPVAIRSDKKRLRQILINLLGNAVKFTEHGSVTFTVGRHYNQFRFQVKDTGIGIKPEQLKSIFSPFRQSASEWRKTGGSGLGLAISQRLAKKLGGELQVKSTLGQGTTFWLDLELEEVPGWEASEPNKFSSAKGYEGPTQKILVVDDKAENRAMLVDILTPLGFELMEAADGKEAIEKANTFKPNLILIDVIMPVMDGFEATEQLRQSKLHKNTPIIAISASAFGDDKNRSAEVGCTGFVVKPFEPVLLLQEIETHLNLTWVYETKQAPPPKASPPPPIVIGPPAEQAQRFFEFVKRGDIKKLRKEVVELEQLDSKYKPFVAEVSELAKKYQLKQIEALLKNFIPK